MRSWVVSCVLSATLCAAVHAQGVAPPGGAPAVKVGDSWRWVRNDRRTGIKEYENTRVIKSVSIERIEASETDGDAVFTPQMSAIETAAWVRTPAPNFIDFPIVIGKKWDFKFAQANKRNSGKSRWEYSAEVVGQEKVNVPAGEFEVFKIVTKGFWNSDNSQRSGRAAFTTWYAPSARTAVKIEYEDGISFNVTELVEFKLQP
jgi:hypothetical protein